MSTLATIQVGDCRDLIAELPDCSVDSIVTDPPYEIGFMGRGWDASGIAYDPTLWAQCWRVLKPGGHLLAFGSTRTYHRMAVAIEDAGFEIRDSIHWLYGSGFPKSLDVSKAIDKAAGAERAVVAIRTDVATRIYDMGAGDKLPSEIPVTAPATDAAKQWEGWGTALKPAHEPIVVARKPLAGTVAANVLAHGTGPLTPTAQTNHHPTVKPLALMRWLVRLVTPPGGTVLEPFAGSGTTMAAAILEDRHVIGCELTAEYLPIIKGRIAWARVTRDAIPPTLFDQVEP